MASKHGVVGLSKVAAVDYGPDNISVAVLAGRLLHHRHGAVRRRRPTGLRGGTYRGGEADAPTTAL
ncbi:hypothetical protein ACWDVX_17720 [Streptomyces tendae]|uniref:hypothetical protein n=1 Tax=Streptomyces sp. RS2 TaxID=1451205 RepID=UPI0035A87915